MADYILTAPPSDGISSMNFSPIENDTLLVSSWDSTLRLYDVQQNISKSTYYFEGPVLSCCFSGNGFVAFSAGLDQTVHSIELTRGAKTPLYSHNAAVSALAFNTKYNSL